MSLCMEIQSHARSATRDVAAGGVEVEGSPVAVESSGPYQDCTPRSRCTLKTAAQRRPRVKQIRHTCHHSSSRDISKPACTHEEARPFTIALHDSLGEEAKKPVGALALGAEQSALRYGPPLSSRTAVRHCTPKQHTRNSSSNARNYHMTIVSRSISIALQYQEPPSSFQTSS